jgi:hypothetical protein
VQLIEQEPGIYDKHHPDYDRQYKIDLAWERISHEMKESGMCIRVCGCVCMYIMTKTCNRIQIQNMSAKAVQRTTTVWSMCMIYSSSSTVIS